MPAVVHRFVPGATASLRPCARCAYACEIFSRCRHWTWPSLLALHLNGLGFGASSESSLSEIPDLTFDIDDTFPTTATLLTWRNSIALFDDISSNIALDNVCARYPTQLAPRNRPSANPTLFLHCCPRVSKHPPFALHKLFTGALGKNRRG